MRCLLPKLAVAALSLVPLPILADVSSGGKTIECYCTDRSGARIELGETICMQVDGRMFMAQCQMSLNVPMWRELSAGCFTSELPQSRKPLRNTAAVDAKI
ncbi:hypothetical protein [Thalassovita sp.]|uniref:hypothetical protein n=1 Tax=Thalassovita sp. TaxID=1979401 RepID=UPI002AB301CF|nr:hypothetical protein [Thalassovita sp.]